MYNVAVLNSRSKNIDSVIKISVWARNCNDGFFRPDIPSPLCIHLHSVLSLHLNEPYLSCDSLPACSAAASSSDESINMCTSPTATRMKP